MLRFEYTVINEPVPTVAILAECAGAVVGLGALAHEKIADSFVSRPACRMINWRQLVVGGLEPRSSREPDPIFYLFPPCVVINNGVLFHRPGKRRTRVTEARKPRWE